MIYKKNKTKTIKQNVELNKKLNKQTKAKSYKDIKLELALIYHHNKAPLKNRNVIKP